MFVMGRRWRIVCAMAAFVASIGAATSARAGETTITPRHIEVSPKGLPPLRIYVEDVGRGRPLVLLHGLGGSGYVWRKVVPELAKSYRVITVDLMGFGRSDKPFHDRYAPQDHARVVLATLQALKLENVALVGHSLGGLVALLATVDANRSDRGRIGALLLFNAPALPQAPTAAVEFLRQPVLPYVLLSLVPADVVAQFGLLAGARRMNHITDTDISFYADPLRGTGGAHAIIQSARQIAPEDPRPVIQSYRRVTQRTLVAGCRDDQTVPIATAKALSRHMRNAKLAVMNGCDHMPMEQNPHAVVRLIRSFATR